MTQRLHKATPMSTAIQYKQRETSTTLQTNMLQYSFLIIINTTLKSFYNISVRLEFQ